MTSTIEVTNLPIEFSWQDVQNLCEERQGLSVRKVEILLSKDTGQSRGVAVVTMVSPEAAQKVVDELDGYEVSGRELKFRLIRDRQPRPPRA